MQYASSLENIEMIETSTFLDPLVGGIPKRSIMEIWGNWSAGKTTLALQAVARGQQDGLKCVWAAVEGYHPRYAASLGVDNSKLGMIVGACAEDILNELYDVFAKGKTDIIFLDSIGALTPREELEKEIGVGYQTGQSRLVAGLLRKIAPAHLMGNETALVFINHSRVDFATGQVKPRGGDSLSFHRSISVRLQPTGTNIKRGEAFVGKRIKATVVKDKIGSNEKKSIEVSLIFGEGFSAAESLIEEAIRKQVIVKSGNTYYTTINNGKIYMSDKKIGTIGKLREWIKTPENTEKIKELIG